MKSAKSRSRPADRISSLPVSVLSYILSFLPTKDAVATHILSMTWSFVWTYVTNLDFSYIGDYKDTKFNDFVNFVNYVMLLHKPAYMNKLSLTLSEYDESIKVVDAWINAWICSAIANNVSEIFVSCQTYKPSIHAQTCMFTSQRLKSLELKCAICISTEITGSLPRLEHLKLTSFDFNDAEGFRKLIDGCPVLKYLFIDASMDFDSKYIISSTSLRHLELYAHRKESTARSVIFLMHHPIAIQLDAPSLEYINLHASDNFYIITFIQPSLTSLEEANFQPRLLTRAFSSGVGAVQAFDRARALTLSSSVMECISSTYAYSTIKIRSKLRRLTRLEVTLDCYHWSVLLELMSLSDSLQVLTIKQGYRRDGYLIYSKSWKTPDLVPSCLSNSLKTVSMDAYDGHELAMVAYILKHGSVLQLMQIRFDISIQDFKTKFEIVQKITKFPRKSLCEVDFC